MKPIKTNSKHDTQPLIELFFKEFPNEDPQEMERLMNTTTKWLEQETVRIQNDKQY
jgi:hypothetical protein